MTQKCRLCQHPMDFFDSARNRDYYRCPQCDSIQLDHEQLLNPMDEKKRYDTHNNDIMDKGYQSFVSPITNYILNHFDKDDQGLDFGAGPGPVISKLLMDQSYSISQYDPFFHPDNELLNKSYDYIIACEVIEHFNHPKSSFNAIKKSTKTNGQWIFMTYLYDDSIDFQKWHYKNDETHVIFYSKKTLEYIKNIYQFKSLIINNRLIIFSN
ncbi:class I SAM-dependent methyltransferase [Hujiaoplasma nucleasis]|uniref:Class I SAM-dependent methyltransferase n=1 Tax=Hujiaoplasma nucleasis TaxID=2725268 RepID=A0A7L6N3K6_9MOLU|nr:class I SAM-dependent methyltransferase [Hujiaoplasma nucleasis]QLY40131.1 class I SAM-dependent methyltransferase [Hujiaoplasma nucleasis]